MRKFFDIDVMLRGRFVHTFRISVLLADKISSLGRKAGVLYRPSGETHRVAYAVTQRPTL